MTESSERVLSETRPFPGLRPFDFSDHAFFFGREAQIAALYLLVDRSRFVAVVGSSGSGKSSLVRAGLLPLLDRENKTAGVRRRRWVTMHPGAAPLHQLARAIADLSTDDDPVIRSASRERIEFALRQSRYGVANALGEVDDLGTDSVVILVDQFEELFRYAGAGATAGQDKIGDARWRDESRHFVQLLLEASRNRTHDVTIVLTMRSDFIGDCARFNGLPEAVSASQFLVPGLTRDQREQVIAGPVKKAGATIDPELLGQLLSEHDDDLNDLDELPVLQHCLARLWVKAGQAGDGGRTSQEAAGETADTGTAGARHLSSADYVAVGGLSGALSEHADEILADLRTATPSDDVPRIELTVEQVFRALSDVDPDGRVTRRALPFDQLVAETGMIEGDLHKVVDRFRADDCSFLVPSPVEERELRAATRIDVGHEALLRRWQRVSADVAAGAPAMGWLRAEEADGRQFRALQSLAEGAEGWIPSDVVEKRWEWWNERPRTKAWAERYGGRFDQVLGLLSDSLKARKVLIAKQEAERTAEQRRLEREAQFAREREAAAIRFSRLSRIATIVVSVLLLVAAGLAVTFFRERQAALRERQAAREQAEIARQQTEIAEKSFKVTLSTTLALLERIGSSLTSGRIKVEEARDWTAVAEENIRALEAIGRPTPSLIAGRVTLLLGFADVYSTLGDTAAALKRSQQALALAEGLVRDQPTDRAWKLLLYATEFRVGDNSPQDNDSARVAYERALKVAHELAGPEADAGTEDLWRIGFVLNKLGDIARVNGKIDDAMRIYKQALVIAQRIADGNPTNVSLQRDLATTRMRIGDLLLQATTPPKLDEALEQYMSMLTALEAQSKKRDDDTIWSNLSVAYNRVGDVLKAQKKYDEAIARYQEGLAIRDRLAAKDRGNLPWQSFLAFEFIYIGDVLFLKKDFLAAIDEYRQALPIRQKLVQGLGGSGSGPETLAWNKNLADTYFKLGEAMYELSRFDEALANVRDALAVRVMLMGRFTYQARKWEVALARIKIGDILTKMNDKPAALVEYQSARDIIAALAAARYATSESVLRELDQKIAALGASPQSNP